MSACFVLSKILGIQANYLLRMGWNMPKVTTTSAGEEKRLLLRAALPHHSLSSSSNKHDYPAFSSQLCPLLLLTQGKGKKKNKNGGWDLSLSLYILPAVLRSLEAAPNTNLVPGPSLPAVFPMDTGMPCSLQNSSNTVQSNTVWAKAEPIAAVRRIYEITQH